MRIAEASASTVSDLWTQIQARVGNSQHLENAAQELATAVHSQFDESVVIARVFVTVPFGALPESNKDFVRKLAESAGAADDLKPGTPVLSLIGTHGQEEDWGDRRKSKGHVGIPLISSSFVGAIPMIARLLQELGVPLDWADSHDTEIIVQTLSGSQGLFFVEDASQATDQEGRKIIAAQEFVSSYDVKSVFGTGGVYPNGQMIVVVVFCRDSFAKSEAEHFLALTQSFKGETTSLAGSAAVFAD